ncbi:MAG: hypothetical protein R2712_23070 [Vicinamibacterales bacterium]
MALAIVLLAQIALTTILSRGDLPTDAVVRTDEVVAATITVPATRYPTGTARGEFYQRLEGRVASEAGIQAVGLTSVMPDRHGTRMARGRGRPQPGR